MKDDKRPQRYGWAPGGYMHRCRTCGEDYSGDKRATLCADCAYALPDPTPTVEANSPQSQAEAMAVEIAEWFCYGDTAQTCTALKNRITTALSKLIAENERLKKEQSETVEAFNALNDTKDKLIATLKSKIEALGGLHVLRDDWTPTPENIAKLPVNIRSQLAATEAKLETARKEIDAFRDTVSERVRASLHSQLLTVESQIKTATKWLRHYPGCKTLIPWRQPKCTCGLDAFLSTLTAEKKEYEPPKPDPLHWECKCGCFNRFYNDGVTEPCVECGAEKKEEAK